jgi:hypothetical protein
MRPSKPQMPCAYQCRILNILLTYQYYNVPTVPNLPESSNHDVPRTKHIRQPIIKNHTFGVPTSTHVPSVPLSQPWKVLIWALIQHHIIQIMSQLSHCPDPRKRHVLCHISNPSPKLESDKALSHQPSMSQLSRKSTFSKSAIHPLRTRSSQHQQETCPIR